MENIPYHISLTGNLVLLFSLENLDLPQSDVVHKNYLAIKSDPIPDPKHLEMSQYKKVVIL